VIGLASVFWDAFWLLFIFIPVTLSWIAAIVDLLVNRRDLKRSQVALWLVAILALPIVGMLVYFATRPDDVPERYPAPAERSARYVQTLKDLTDLRDRGVISDEEYEEHRGNLRSAQPLEPASTR
jgi:hypothetical protein